MSASVQRQYGILLREFGLPAAVVSSAAANLRPPLAAATYPAPWYGYPPALVPLWSQGYVYTGLWRHWFSERPASFVEVFVRDGHRVVEVARTSEQFFAYVTVSAIVASDGLSSEVRAFADTVGVANIEELDALTLASGDDPQGLGALRQFRREVPLVAVARAADYDGWFPRPCFDTAIPWWRHCCSLEVTDAVRSAWPTERPLPIWIDERPSPRMLLRFLEDGDLGSAWLTLNSSGWELTEARGALAALAEAAQDPLFSLLATAWLAASDGQEGCY